MTKKERAKKNKKNENAKKWYRKHKNDEKFIKARDYRNFMARLKKEAKNETN